MHWARTVLVEIYEPPNYIDEHGVMYWYRKPGIAVLHRKAAPAVVHPEGETEYYCHGKYIDSINTMSFEAQKDYIMSEFNFDSVHKMMQAVDWTYFNNTHHLAGLKKTASRLLDDVKKAINDDEEYFCSTGGFKASASIRGLKLQFIAECVSMELER